MKKLTPYAILIILILGISTTATAIPITNFGEQVGGIINQVVFIGNTSTGIIDGDPFSSTDFSPNILVDSLHNVNFIIDQYNPGLPDAYNQTKYEEPASGSGLPVPDWHDKTDWDLALPFNTQYISLKWGSSNKLDSDGGWFLWYVGDIWTSMPDGTNYTPDGLPLFEFNLGADSPGLSHYSIWNSSIIHTPEPTTFLLLGLGLMGIAGIGRKK